ncbi:OLC1v1013321C1 [Oldenlandia corymbosa var. corymbosa]|uniref:OLC1v1013321C1 n=1 Tax=Oldenlandia corymbosa var. corymbosa TaxID=529605 RepID=A0AAV1E1M5_OLDCO|nr:OLC1v1013321C1 [Oldenlandia corymbosa var. corymbosa]
MESKNFHFFNKAIPLVLLFLATGSVNHGDAVKGFSKGGKGKWELLLNSSGVVAMHAALTRHDTVVILDQAEGQSDYHLRRRLNGTKCEETHADIEDSSCYAHSVEYDILSNKIRPLSIQTDTWCSSGSILNDGRIVQAGGYGDGGRKIRYFEPCDVGNTCDWREAGNHLADRRWYASTLSLPENDQVIVVGGQRIFTYEFVPKSSSESKSFDLPFLHRTYESKSKGNNLYPFLHLSSDGNIFIFANRDSILFDYKRRKVVKTYPRIPMDGSRSYPSTASSVILPLDHKHSFLKVEVMICGGAVRGAYAAARGGRFLKGLNSCGRMVITGNNHKWRMEKMAGPRIMSDMVILPTGHVLIINGARRGCAGWKHAASPALHPFLYKPEKSPGRRFSILKATKIPRMYHSTATLLPDGRVLVAGSNPNKRYEYTNVKYPTELRLQAFVPDHMDRKFNHRRAHNVSITASTKEGSTVVYGGEFEVRFLLRKINRNGVKFTAHFPPFTTHSISMNQRMLKLRCKEMVKDKDGWVNATVEAPPSSIVAPAGYYLLTVVNGGIPSTSNWIRFANN